MTTIFDDLDGAISSAICPSATVSQVPDPVGAIVLLDSGGVFEAGGVSVTQTGPARFQVCLPFRKGLPAGAHQGVLTLQICRDAACGQLHPLTGNTLPYDVVVYHAVPDAPAITAEIAVGGTVLAATSPGLRGTVRTYRIAAKVGQIVEIRPSVPFIAWAYAGSASVRAEVSSTVAAPAFRVGLPIGPASGSAEVRGRTIQGQTVEVTVSVTQP